MGLRAVGNPAAGGQPGSFTTLTVTGAATIGGGLAVTGIQTITANSASPALDVVNSGGGFSARFTGGAIYALNGMLTNDDIGLWAGDSSKKISFDGSGNVVTTTGLAVTGSISATDYIAGAEQTPPSAPAANGYRIFAQDNGAGKTQLMVIFATGAAQQIAIEP